MEIDRNQWIGLVSVWGVIKTMMSIPAEYHSVKSRAHKNISMCPYSPYSPALAPRDCWLLPNVKKTRMVNVCVSSGHLHSHSSVRRDARERGLLELLQRVARTTEYICAKGEGVFSKEVKSNWSCNFLKNLNVFQSYHWYLIFFLYLCVKMKHLSLPNGLLR